MQTSFLKSLFTSAICLISGAVHSDASLYEGIYEGTIAVYDSYDDYEDEGIFVAHVDNNGSTTMWAGNNESAGKYVFKVDSSGEGQFTDDGTRVFISISPSGSITASDNEGSSYRFQSTKVSMTDRSGTKKLADELRTKAKTSFSMEWQSGYAPPASSIASLQDQLLLMAGQWRVNSARVVFDGLGAVTLTGDMIILPNSIYTYGIAKDVKILTRQNPLETDYSTFRLYSVTADWLKRKLSAKGSAYIDGHYGSVNYTVTQNKSFYDSDADGLSNSSESTESFTDPYKADTDGDKIGDADELGAGTDPSNRMEFPVKLTVSISMATGVMQPSPTADISIDTVDHEVVMVNGRGTKYVYLPSGRTYIVSSNSMHMTGGESKSVTLTKATTLAFVLDGDADGDGLPDSLEAKYKCDPQNADSDGDGISDGDEVNLHRTLPNEADSDRDGFTDAQEIRFLSNPLISKDKPAAYIESQVQIALALAADGDDPGRLTEFTTVDLSAFLSEAAGQRREGASLYLRTNLQGTDRRWFVRSDQGDLNVSRWIGTIKVSMPGLLEATASSSANTNDGSQRRSSMFTIQSNIGSKKSLNLLIAGETMLQPVPGELFLLSPRAEYPIMGTLIDPSRSAKPMILWGTMAIQAGVPYLLD